MSDQASPLPAAEPRITAPVSRYLGTKDIDRAVRFWRDVLGFEVHQPPDDGTAVLQSGRARIRFGKDDCEGPAVIFFDTDDVEGMRSLIQQRGGEPGGLEKVNWIKRRVFEVRDPDGHVIWFGQSYDVRSPDRPRSMMNRVMPELPFDDVSAAVTHYRDVLGFVINYQQDDIGVLDRDEVRVLLVRRTPQHSGIGSA